MRDAVRRLFSVRPQPRIVQLRVPSIIAGRRGLPVLLSAFAVVAAASTAATTSVAEQGNIAAPAGTTVLPPAAPPTYSYPGSPAGGETLPAGARAPGGTGLNGGRSGGTASTQLASSGIPSRAVQAYQAAATAADCGIPWTRVAAIGRVESNHGQFAGATLLSDGRSDPPIVGIPLDGRPGVAEIKDTDGGKWDGDTTYDRAVGPMQFIPSSWATFGVDGDRDGKADPFDIDDAAASAAKYLCRAGGGNLSSEASQRGPGPVATIAEAAVKPASISERIVPAFVLWMSAASFSSSRRKAMSRSSYQSSALGGTGTMLESEAAMFRHSGRIVPSAKERRAMPKLPAFRLEPCSPSDSPAMTG